MKELILEHGHNNGSVYYVRVWDSSQQHTTFVEDYAIFRKQ